MKAVILCGGQSMRMGGGDIPKPMVKIGNSPVVWHIMKYLSYYKIYTSVLALGYKQEVFKKEFYDSYLLSRDFCLSPDGITDTVQDRNSLNMDIWFVDTGENTDTYGRIWSVNNLIDYDDIFLVCYGDVLANVNINELVKTHIESDNIATLTAHRTQSRFGILDIDFNGKVIGIQEKPLNHDLINIGFIVFSSEIFKLSESLFGRDNNKSMENVLLPILAEEGKLGYYEHAGFYHPMDNYKEYVLLNEMWNEGKAPWKIW